MKKTIVALLVLVFALATVTGVVLAKNNTEPVFAVCVITDTGIPADFPNGVGTCPFDNETYVTYNQQGPTGPQGPIGPKGDTGPQGLPGTNGVSGYMVKNSGWQHVAQGVIVKVLCPDGDNVLGGGADMSSSTNDQISHSKPVGGLNGWEAAYSGSRNAIRVWAVCAKVAA